MVALSIENTRGRILRAWFEAYFTHIHILRIYQLVALNTRGLFRVDV